MAKYKQSPSEKWWTECKKTSAWERMEPKINDQMTKDYAGFSFPQSHGLSPSRLLFLF